MFYSQTDLGVSSALGTDMFNIGVIYTILLVKVTLSNQSIPEESKVSNIKILKLLKNKKMFDPWFFMRDSIFYGAGLAILIVLLSSDVTYWWMGLILFLYTIFFFVFSSKDSDIREFF